MRRYVLPLFVAGLCLAGTAAPRAQEQQADPKAVALMREVYQKRYTWDDKFPGFEGALTVSHHGEAFHGKARVSKELDVELELANPTAASWAKDALLSIAGHRRAAPFDRGDGRYPLTFGPPDAHPAGRLIRLNDSMGSTYRVRDGQILQVNRMAGPKLRFTIDMLENLVTEDGRYLPRTFTVSYFQVPGGALSRSQTFRDEYRKVGGYLLPASRLEITAEDGGTEHASLKLDDVRLLP